MPGARRRRVVCPIRLPPAAPGLRIGLYGGSFNPPHPGHRHVALTALRRLRLDRVWWIVTPGNPLKDVRELASEEKRLAATRAVAKHPRFAVTGFEAELGVVYTVETLRFLLLRRPDLRFVWIMGADSLASFHRWRHWREMASLVPIAIVDRPGWTLRAATSRAAEALARARVPERDATLLPDLPAPAWTLLHGPRSNLSSTVLRRTQRVVDTR
ncbi:MAG: nicotinate-nucleotide adenylyltransferase [Methylobacteriaceae bacterium]|nr:nicotinate-nucleotide adenylyltransferase [Methylobacteriaceae bacterium]